MKRYILLFVLIFSMCVPNYSFAANEQLEQKLVNIGLFSSSDTDDQKDIEKLFKKHSKYANSQNMKKLDALYAENYHNFDGLSRKDFFNMIKETWTLYKDLNYTSEIKSVIINGAYADVEIVEIAKGKTKNLCDTTKKIGNITSQSTVIYNLQKFGKTWKITSDNVLREQTFLLYGEANNLAMTLNAPSQVVKGEKYTVAFDVNVPKGYFALASITNEDIIYPQKPPKEVFRNIKKDVALEREISANNNNHNEYAIASIGLTKPSMTEDDKLHIDVVGLGFLMNRVNVLPSSKDSK